MRALDNKGYPSLKRRVRSRTAGSLSRFVKCILGKGSLNHMNSHFLGFVPVFTSCGCCPTLCRINRWKSVKSALKRGGILPDSARVVLVRGRAYLQQNHRAHAHRTRRRPEGHAKVNPDQGQGQTTTEVNLEGQLRQEERVNRSLSGDS